jgi:hypothetical protein
MYQFNPTPAQAGVLAQIAQRESSGNYQAYNPSSQASGAYQFKPDTWALATQNTGVPYYATAGAAPDWVQDTNALWLLRQYGPNATISWAASAPPGGYPLVDLTGDAAAMPTADILSQIGGSITDTMSSWGLDPSTPAGGLAIALGLAAGGLLVMAVLEK